MSAVSSAPDRCRFRAASAAAIVATELRAAFRSCANTGKTALDAEYEHWRVWYGIYPVGEIIKANGFFRSAARNRREFSS